MNTLLAKKLLLEALRFVFCAGWRLRKEEGFLESATLIM
jgi:hypothetical protein